MACVAFVSPVSAECAPEPQGEGRIASVLDARTLKLDDGRVIRLTGIAALRDEAARPAQAALSTLADGRLVSLHGESDSRDRYGRQRAWVFAQGAETSLQEALIAGGHGVRDLGIADAACRQALESAENKARAARFGLWSTPQAIKNAENADDISHEIGHFVVIGGRVRAVREAGGWTYLNFGRRWRDGFTAAVPKGASAAFEKAGLPLKGFEGQQVLVRGHVMLRRGPRIEVTTPEQIEVVGTNAVATTGTRD